MQKIRKTKKKTKKKNDCKEHWSILVDAMQQFIPLSEQLRSFKTMKGIATNLMQQDITYRTLYVDNEKVQNLILKYDGGFEFLLSLGFREMQNRTLICLKPNYNSVSAAIRALNNRIQLLESENVDINSNQFKPVRYEAAFSPKIDDSNKYDNHVLFFIFFFFNFFFKFFF